MTNIYLKPAVMASGEIAIVRDPSTQIPLAEVGEWKVASPFWTRRLRDGDVVEGAPSAVDTVAPSALPAAISPAPFAPCADCVSPIACEAASRCVKAPI